MPDTLKEDTLMTTHQMKWAATHDWFRSSNKLGPNNYAVRVIEKGCGDMMNPHPDDVITQIITFTDFQALYDWAGY